MSEHKAFAVRRIRPSRSITHSWGRRATSRGLSPGCAEPVATPERFNAGMWRSGKSEFRYLFRGP